MDISPIIHIFKPGARAKCFIVDTGRGRECLNLPKITFTNQPGSETL